MSKKPTPAPLDDENANPSNADVPHAESGRATEADVKLAAAKDAAAARDAAIDEHATEARTAPAPAAPEVTRAANKLAGGIAIPASPVDVDDDRPRAVIADRSGQFVARPDPTKPISTTEPVVLGNWVGRYKDAAGNDCPAYVKHGTPISGLPSDLAQAIVETRGQVVGPIPPKAPPNPFTP